MDCCQLRNCITFMKSLDKGSSVAREAAGGGGGGTIPSPLACRPKCEIRKSVRF